MNLNVNFNNELEPMINSIEQLANWFERNQETLAYFELTHVGCTLDDLYSSHEMIVLGRMANACLTWLESKGDYTNREKAKNAVIAMADIYEKEKNTLTDIAKRKYYISAKGYEKESSRRK